MLSSSYTQPTNDFIALEHAIHHDIVDMEDTDEFLAVEEVEDCVHACLCEAGAFASA